jgi:REP element-mobilizing transposase RayT
MHLPHVTPFAKAPIYFFTACTASRQKVLANRSAVGALVDVWRKSADHNGWFVGAYVVMPDHVHFFASPRTDADERSVWCKAWKSISSRAIMRLLGLEPPLWQPDTFDHILRSSESYAEKWHYVRLNPVRAGLVTHAEQWPWQGEICSLQL